MKFEDFREKAVALLDACPMTAAELARATGATSAVYPWLKKLVDAGVVIKCDGGIYRLPDVEDEPAEPAKVEVCEMRMPRPAMTVSKPKLATVTPIAPTKTAIAPYLQEQQAEETWAFILRHANISDGMTDPSNVSKLSGNWRYFVVDIDLCGLGLMSVETITGQFKAYLDGKAKKGASLIDPRDISIFIADKVWEAKLTNDAILNPALKLQAQFWQCDRTYRNRLHEALIKSGKWFITEMKGLLSLGGVELSTETLGDYLKEYEKRQQIFLDDLLNSRQSQAKKVVAQEIGKALSVHQLPEAK